MSPVNRETYLMAREIAAEVIRAAAIHKLQKSRITEAVGKDLAGIRAWRLQ